MAERSTKAKRALQEIWMAETKADAEAAFDAFIGSYQTKYDKAAECVAKDRDALLTFYDFPPEHWKHRRDPALLELLDESVRVISFVADEGVRLDLVEKRRSLSDVGRLPRRQRQRDRVAECIDNGVDLRRQAAAGTTNGLILAVFFWAPALC
jgi:hypothetical protein